MKSRRKGKDAENEVATLLRDFGFTDARRSVQYSGANGDADVLGLPDCHVEVKRRESGSVYEWLEKAREEAAAGRTPVVFHRRSRKPWIVILPAEDFLSILRDAERGLPRTPAPLREAVTDERKVLQ